MNYMKKIKEISQKIVLELSGIVLFSIGVHSFVAYNNIAPGGITGIATMIYYIWGIPIGVISFLFNCPLLLLGFFCMGRRTVLRTLITVFGLSFMLDIGIAWIPIYTGNLVGAAVVGGTCMGSGLSLILRSHTTTGGGDLLGKIIQIRYPKISMGKILLIIDFLVIGISAFVYGEFKHAIYGVFTMAISSIIVDAGYRPKVKTEMPQMQ